MTDLSAQSRHAKQLSRSKCFLVKLERRRRALDDQVRRRSVITVGSEFERHGVPLLAADRVAVAPGYATTASLVTEAVSANCAFTLATVFSTVRPYLRRSSSCAVAGP